MMDRHQGLGAWRGASGSLTKLSIEARADMSRAVWLGAAIGAVIIGLVVLMMVFGPEPDDGVRVLSEPELTGPQVNGPTTPPSPASPPPREAQDEPARLQPPEPRAEVGEGEGEAAKADLPSLENSDEPVREALESAFGQRPIKAFLIPERIIYRVVVTVDNLDGKPVALEYWPAEHVSGRPPVIKREVDGETRLYLDPANADRYAPYVSALQAADANAIVGLYRRYYPLFQETYAYLGHKERRINERLLSVIDHLMQTPDVDYPIRLTQPKVLYRFADPELESLSWGQKLLIRMGPDNRHAVLDKLAEIRDLIGSREFTALP